MLDLSELLERAQARGYDNHFHVERGRFHDGLTWLRSDQARLIDTVATDTGTDPGDDATVYLIKAESGRRGFVILGDGPHVAPEVAAFVDQLLQEREHGK